MAREVADGAEAVAVVWKVESEAAGRVLLDYNNL